MLDNHLGKGQKLGTVHRVGKGQMTYFAAFTVLDFAEVNVHHACALETEIVDKVRDNTVKIFLRAKAALRARVEVSEVDCRNEKFRDFAKFRHFLGVAYLIDFSHGFGTENHVVKTVCTDKTCKNFNAFFRKFHRFGSGKFAHSRRVKNNTLAAEYATFLRAGKDVIVGLFRHGVIGIGKIDVVRRMH